MSTKKAPLAKAAPLVDPEAEVMEDPAPSPAPPAPAPAGAGTTPGATGGAEMASSIPVVVGTPGYYTGARDAETKAQYDARMGSDAGTFGDLGWMLGTAPKV